MAHVLHQAALTPAAAGEVFNIGSGRARAKETNEGNVVGLTRSADFSACGARPPPKSLWHLLGPYPVTRTGKGVAWAFEASLGCKDLFFFYPSRPELRVLFSALGTRTS